MLRRYSTDFAILSMVLDAVFVVVALMVAAFVRPSLHTYFSFVTPHPEGQVPAFVYGLAPLVWVGVLLIVSAYDPRHTYKAVDEFSRVAFGILLAALCFAGLLYLTERSLSRWLFGTFVVLVFVFLLAWRVGMRVLWRIRKLPPKERRVLIIGAGQMGRQVAQMIDKYAWTGLRFVGYLDDCVEKQQHVEAPILGALDDVARVVQKYDVEEVVITLPRRAYEKVEMLVVTLHELPVHTLIVPDYLSLALYRASVEEFAGIPMINVRAPALNEYQRMLKRIFDLSVGGLATLMALPVMGLIALAIKLDSPGPILFRQVRVGENGRLFTMYKFRTMVVGAEKMQALVNEVTEDGKIIHKKRDDPRVTRVGRFLRRTSLDELPQLFNVLKGEMSLVGPRPELPWLVEQYEPWQRKRFCVPQGITGWWQVNGRSDKPMHLHTEDDLFYVQNYSFWLDLKILWRTVWIVLFGKGAY
ncbi:MAG: sugar transferase [Ardenticatenia bacterium]|nr:MAG: sugar transferase [Ardenticatenia bacterium]